MTEPNLITTAQAAEILGYSKRHVARLVDAGHLTPELKFPGWRGGYLFTPAEVARFRAERDLAAAQPRAKAS
jgi:excisionase family DNA binding protein